MQQGPLGSSAFGWYGPGAADGYGAVATARPSLSGAGSYEISLGGVTVQAPALGGAGFFSNGFGALVVGPPSLGGAGIALDRPPPDPALPYSIDVGWRVAPRSELFTRSGELDTYQLDAVLRLNAVSTWVLTVPASLPQADLFVLAKGGLIVTRDGAVVLSGPTRKIERTPDFWTLSGSDDTVQLADHIAPPVADSSDFSTAEYWEQTGPAETVLRTLVEANFGPTAARPERRSFGLSSAVTGDTALGETVAVKARFDNVLSLAQEIALGGGGLRFRVAQASTDEDTVELLVEEARDLRDDVVFSLEQGNLATYKDVRSSPTYNAITAAGIGQAQERVIVELQDVESLSLYGRREYFYDRRAAVGADELLAYARTFLAEHAEVRQTSITPIDTDAVAFLRDYTLGDLVRVLLEGEVLDGVIREVALKIDQNGARFTPTIGTPGVSDDPISARMLAAIERRVGNIERMSRIAAGGITSELMGAGSVLSAAIGVGAVLTGALGDGSVTASKLAAGSVTRAALGANGFPIGAVVPYGGTVAPPLWLLCQGQVLLQASYPELFGVVGTYHNIGGEAAGSFRLPNLYGRVPLGAGTVPGGATHQLGQIGGVESVNISHTHDTDLAHGHSASSQASNSSTSNVNVVTGTLSMRQENHTHPVTVTSLGTTPKTSDGKLSASQSILQPFVVLSYLIFANA